MKFLNIALIFIIFCFVNQISPMQQSSIISIEQESSPVMISHYSSENSLNKINKVR
jgi:hypothetical protein